MKQISIVSLKPADHKRSKQQRESRTRILYTVNTDVKLTSQLKNILYSAGNIVLIEKKRLSLWSII